MTEPARPRYRLRRTGGAYLAAGAAVILLPASLLLAAIAAALSGCLLLRTGRMDRRAVAIGLAAGLLVATYTVVAFGSWGRGLGSGALMTTVVVAACTFPDRHGHSWLVEQRTIAFVEMFVYASAVGVLGGVGASDENRLFLTSTTGQQRFSFAFASSPSQAAMLAGAAVVLAVAAPTRMAGPRRVMLFLVGAFLVIGANYRYEIVVVALTLGVALGLRRVRRPLAATLATFAVGMLAVPIWWPPVSTALDGPVVTVVSTVPGLGTRRSNEGAVEEARTLNQRTVVWDENWRLAAGAPVGRLLFGYGPEGGDRTYNDVVGAIVSDTFVSTDTISSHNTPLEMTRRAGLLLGGGSVVGVVWLLVRALRRRPPQGAALVATLLVASGGLDISVTPTMSATTVLFAVVCAPYLKVRRRGRGVRHATAPSHLSHSDTSPVRESDRTPDRDWISPWHSVPRR